MNEFWNVLMQISIVVVGLVAGGTFVVPSINWLKQKLNLSGERTLWLVGAVATIITVSGAIVDGVLTQSTVTPTTWGAVLLAIILNSQIRYRQLKDDLDNTKE